MTVMREEVVYTFRASRSIKDASGWPLMPPEL
jgi:hypothetical protein